MRRKRKSHEGPQARAAHAKQIFAAEQPTTLATPAAAETLDVLERGSLYFLYLPAVEGETPHGLVDLQRFYLVLRPEGSEQLRRIVIGHKKLPVPTDARQRFWAFVDGIGDREASAPALAGARPAGEGAYALVRHHGHTHLSYALALPATPGAVQQELNILPEASYLVVVKNPQATSPPGLGLDEARKAELPETLQARFGDRRFLALDTPAFLEQPGCELLLLGSDEDLEQELGFRVDASRESCQADEVLAALRLAVEQTPIAPLIDGTWA